MLGKQDRVRGYRHGPVASEGAQGNLTPGAGPNVDNLPDGVGEDEDCDFDGASGGESAQRVGIKHMFLGLQDECRIKQRTVPTNAAVAVELEQEMLRSADVPVNTIPFLEVAVITEGIFLS